MTAGTSTIGWRPTSSRPRWTPRGSRRSWSRRRSGPCHMARRASASCRWMSGRRRSSPPSPTPPASGSTTCRPARNGSSRRWPACRAVAGLRPGASEPARTAMSVYRFTVNAAATEVDVPGMRRLLDVLREDLALTGTKEGCGEGECGACTVLLDGARSMPASCRSARSMAPTVRTVEGLGPWSTARRPRRAATGDRDRDHADRPGRRRAPVGLPRDGRRPVRDLHARDADVGQGLPRCRRGPDEDAIRDAIAGNLCRCTGYTKIIDAIALAARRPNRRHGMSQDTERIPSRRTAPARSSPDHAPEGRTGAVPLTSAPATGCGFGLRRGVARPDGGVHAEPARRRLRDRGRVAAPGRRRSSPARSARSGADQDHRAHRAARREPGVAGATRTVHGRVAAGPPRRGRHGSAWSP